MPEMSRSAPPRPTEATNARRWRTHLCVWRLSMLAASLQFMHAAPAQPMADVLTPGAPTEVFGERRADDAPRWQPGEPRGGQADWQTTAPPSALQRLFRPDLPKPAPNPFGVPTMASAPRVFPEQSKLGSMTPGVFPLVSIDGKAMRFGAGALIRNQSNMLVLPATLSGATWPVRYTIDSAGNIGQAWILTDAELAAEARRPRTSQGAAPAW